MVLSAKIKKWTKQLTKKQLTSIDPSHDEDDMLFSPQNHESDEDLNDSPDYKQTETRSVLRNKIFAPELDPKYIGKVVRRRDLYDSEQELSLGSDSEVSGSDEEGRISGRQFKKGNELDNKGRVMHSQSQNEAYDDDEESVEFDDELGSADSEDNIDEDSMPPKFLEPQPNLELARQLEILESGEDIQRDESSMFVMRRSLQTDKKANDEKAVHMMNQRKLWGLCMDMRIKVEKVLQSSNRIPESFEFRKAVDESIELQDMSNKLNDQLYRILVKVEKFRGLISDKSSEEIVVEEYPRVKDLFSSTILPDMNERKQEHLLDIDKWSMKTQLSQGKWHKLKANDLNVLNQSVSNQIKLALGDSARLIARSRISKIPIEPIRISSSIGDVSCNIYDDSDFYHKLLKDLVHSGVESGLVGVFHDLNETLTGSVSAKKKQKDTKASKGRKVRYTVEPKLVNFMAPEPLRNDMESISSELFLALYKNMKAREAT